MVIAPADAFRQATEMIARAELELTSKGYHEGIVAGAIARADGQAKHWTNHYSDDLRGQAYLQTLRMELARAEHWCIQASKPLP